MGYVNGGQRAETKPLRDHTKCNYIFYDAPQNMTRKMNSRKKCLLQRSRLKLFTTKPQKENKLKLKCKNTKGKRKQNK